MLNKYGARLIFLFLLALNISGDVYASELAVTVNNVKSSNGKIIAQLCDKDTFLKQCPFRIQVKATKGTIILNFKGVPAGKYAISLFHDENDNGKLERNMLGIPTEGYGFSRNARGFRAPPSFINAAFDVKEGNNQTSLKIFN